MSIVVCPRCQRQVDSSQASYTQTGHLLCAQCTDQMTVDAATSTVNGVAQYSGYAGLGVAVLALASVARPGGSYLPVIGVLGAVVLGGRAIGITNNPVTAEELGSKKNAIRICGILAIVVGLGAAALFTVRVAGFFNF